MPWMVETFMSQRQEFVTLAQADGVNRSALCRRFRISRKTGEKWLRRYREGGTPARQDRSPRPLTGPGASALPPNRSRPSTSTSRMCHPGLRTTATPLSSLYTPGRGLGEGGSPHTHQFRPLLPPAPRATDRWRGLGPGGSADSPQRCRPRSAGPPSRPWASSGSALSVRRVVRWSSGQLLAA